MNLGKHHGCSNFVTEFLQMVQVKFFKKICNVTNYTIKPGITSLSSSYVFCYGYGVMKYRYPTQSIRLHWLSNLQVCERHSWTAYLLHHLYCLLSRYRIPLRWRPYTGCYGLGGLCCTLQAYSIVKFVISCDL